MILFLCTLLSKDFYIYEVSNRITRSKHDQVATNYFINMGEREGVQEGLLVDVWRQITAVNNLKNYNNAIIAVKIAQLQIVAVGEKSSIAHLKSKIGKVELDNNFPMLGDRIKIAPISP